MSGSSYFTTIFDIDFAELYREHARNSLRQPKKSEDWDKKASRMGDHSSIANDYISAFLSRMDFNGVDTALDIGCGGGTIALAIAPMIENVYALDYSPKMLKVVDERAEVLGITNYETILRSWEDDWSDIPECDICISSRSSMVMDLASALAKLNQKAKKAVYMTMTVEKDFMNREILKVLGRDYIGFPTYIYAVNLLYQQGYRVSVDFIEANHHDRQQTIRNIDDFIQAVKWSIGDLTAQEVDTLIHYYEEEGNAFPPIYYTNRPWAFLKWRTDHQPF